MPKESAHTLLGPKEKYTINSGQHNIPATQAAHAPPSDQNIGLVWTGEDRRSQLLIFFVCHSFSSRKVLYPNITNEGQDVDRTNKEKEKKSYNYLV